ncbi:MAG: S9 family peptidase [Bryobacterales bacterium]|nr:S9 family peptidase [Bryobacterales bacterium]
MARTAFCALLLACIPLAAQTAKRPFDVYALQRVVRVSDPQLSPDGARVAFVVERVFLADNAKERQIWIVPAEGGEPKQATFQGKSNTRPRWSPDSQSLAYVSDRSGKSQIWLMHADGTQTRQITDLSTEADGVLFSPAGDRIVFQSRVYAKCGADDACNKRELEATETEPVKAQLFDKLLYRHWDHWDDGRVGHLFSMALNQPDAGPVDLTPGDFDAPTFSLGGPDDYAIAPDGGELCFVRKTVERPELSTDTNLFVVPMTGGEPVKLTSNPAADLSPAYSPDGRYLSYRRQDRAGYESDRWRLIVLERDTGNAHSITDAIDRSVTSAVWAPDSSRLFFTTEDRGRQPVFTARPDGSSQSMVIYGNAVHDDLQIAPDVKSIIYTAQSGARPIEIYRSMAAGGQPQALTNFNADLWGQFETTPLEDVEWTGQDGVKISGFLVKPPAFDAQKRYPLLVLIHGGPQGAWGESWSYRWNPQVFAAAGYVVFLPNPRGSTGYGQAFTDEIRTDWGGKPFDDILAGVDHVIAKPWVDATQLFAAGASYGGYMIDWMLGHTERFRAFVSHAGVYDLPSMYGATEELWFPRWEFEGAPWEKPELYDELSPSRYVEKFKTPTLVVHGQKDYRVPVTQGMQLFTALQERGVPSEFLYFPDEGHWVLKPRNSVKWHETVLGWLDRWRR